MTLAAQMTRKLSFALFALVCLGRPAEAITYSFSGQKCQQAYYDGLSQIVYNSLGAGNPLDSSELNVSCPVAGIESTTVDITSATARVYDATSAYSISCSIEIRTQSGTYYNSAVRYSCTTDPTNGCATNSVSGTGYLGMTWTDPLNGGAAMSNVMSYALACTIPRTAAGVLSYILGYRLTQVNP